MRHIVHLEKITGELFCRRIYEAKTSRLASASVVDFCRIRSRKDLSEGRR